MCIPEIYIGIPTGAASVSTTTIQWHLEHTVSLWPSNIYYKLSFCDFVNAISIVIWWNPNLLNLFLFDTHIWKNRKVFETWLSKHRLHQNDFHGSYWNYNIQKILVIWRKLYILTVFTHHVIFARRPNWSTTRNRFIITT